MLILVIEDSSTMRQLICHAVRSIANTIVIEATDGADGLAKLDEIHPDVIMTDLNMPNVDGFAFIEHLRRRPDHRTTPVIVLTTESANEDRERARKLGVTSYLTKPCRQQDVVSVVSSVVGARPESGAARSPQREAPAVVLRVDYESVDDLLDDYEATLAHREIVVANSRVLPQGTAVQMALSFPGLVEPIMLDGVVRSWDDADAPILNIELTDAAQCEKLASIVETIGAAARRAQRVRSDRDR